MKRAPLRSKPKQRQEKPRLVSKLPGSPRTEPLRISDGRARMRIEVPKERPIQNDAYMASVRRLPCKRCGIQGYTQFCHSDEGKGLAIKSDCRLGWPGCGPHDGKPGCHWLVGTSGQLSKAERREFEARASSETRAELKALGLWPRSLPDWPNVGAKATSTAPGQQRSEET